MSLQKRGLPNECQLAMLCSGQRYQNPEHRLWSRLNYYKKWQFHQHGANTYFPSHAR